MEQDDNDVDELDEVRRKLNSLDDFARVYVMDQLDRRDERIDDLERRTKRLEESLIEVQEGLEAMVGLTESERSTPEKRAFDLYATLVRRAESRNAKGFVMWWQEAYDALCDIGHDDLQGKTNAQAKPLVHTAMDDAAELYDAVDITVKPAITADGSKRDVKAVRVKLDELPSGASVKQFTTVGGPEAPSEQIQTTAIQQNPSD